MNKTVAALAAAALVAGALAGPATAAKTTKKVAIYQAEKCHMYFSPAQAKQDHYVCPDSKGKMHKMMVTSAFASKVLAKSSKTNGTM